MQFFLFSDLLIYCTMKVLKAGKDFKVNRILAIDDHFAIIETLASDGEMITGSKLDEYCSTGPQPPCSWQVASRNEANICSVYLSLQIISQEKSFVVYASNDQEKNAWLCDIRAAIQVSLLHLAFFSSSSHFTDLQRQWPWCVCRSRVCPTCVGKRQDERRLSIVCEEIQHLLPPSSLQALWHSLL